MTELLLPGKKTSYIGTLHPFSLIVIKITEILESLGYLLIDSPEVETSENNFDCLNIPLDHSSRSFQDTFYFENELLLRTHTSNTQSRYLKEHKNQEFKVFTIGKVYRRDKVDATHSIQFLQLEVFAVLKNCSFLYLTSTLVFFIRKLLGPETIFRFRSSYFPFTVPSIELDILCNCSGSVVLRDDKEKKNVWFVEAKVGLRF